MLGHLKFLSTFLQPRETIKVRLLSAFLFVAVVSSLDAFSSVSMVRYDEKKVHFSFFPLDEEGNLGTNSCSVSLQFLRELDPSFNVIASFDPSIGEIDFSYIPPETPSTFGGLRYLHAHQVIYTNLFTGAEIILFLFTADQTVTDIGSGKEIEVKNGDIKNSYRLPFFPFTSPLNLMEFSILIETQIPDSIYYCNVPDEESQETRSLLCEAEDISANISLLTGATTTNILTGEKNSVPVDIDIFVCPINEEGVETQDEGVICPISLDEVGTYPLFYDCDREVSIAAIEVLEIRVRFPNFQYAILDYDPDFSVLLGGQGSGRDGCDSSEGYIIIAWLSLAVAALTIFLVVLVIIIIELWFRKRAYKREKEFKDRANHFQHLSKLETNKSVQAIDKKNLGT